MNAPLTDSCRDAPWCQPPIPGATGSTRALWPDWESPKDSPPALAAHEPRIQEQGHQHRGENHQQQPPRKGRGGLHEMLILVYVGSLHLDSAAGSDSQQRIGFRFFWSRGLFFFIQRQAVYAGEPCVLADAPHVPGEQQQHSGREDNAMQDVKTQDSVLVDFGATQKEKPDLCLQSDKWHWQCLFPP